MGTCCHKEEQQESTGALEYTKVNTLNVIRYNSMGKNVGTSKVTFKNTSPMKQQHQQSVLGKKGISISGCILPGLDPRGEIDKECQDNYTFLPTASSLLCALYDGHGREGLKVSNFCVQFTEKFFAKNTQALRDSTEATLTRLLLKCDEKLKRGKINCEMSGSTAVLVYISESSIYSASLGDSRALMSTLSEEAFPVPESPHKYCKKISIKRNLRPVPLTTDQKPNHEDEFARIQSAGGSVEQILDSFGRPVGPYRVWLPGNDHPGLAMSRSLGDLIAKRVGVIATPVCHCFQMYGADQFVVLASDGIWDVMENIEVVNFVEKVKKSCGGESGEFPAKPENSSIARMLCEEARYRWYGIIEAEDVMIDDISCIIVDFEQLSGDMKAPARERNVVAFQSMAINSHPDSPVTDINEEDTSLPNPN